MVAVLLAHHRFDHTVADAAEQLSGFAALVAAAVYWRVVVFMRAERDRSPVRFGVGIAAAVVSILAFFRMAITLDLMSSAQASVFILPMTVVVYGVHVWMAFQLLNESRARIRRQHAEDRAISTIETMENVVTFERSGRSSESGADHR